MDLLTSRQSELELFSLSIPTVILLSFVPFLMLYLSGTSNARGKPRGCKRAGVRFWSNMSDQFDNKYDKGSDAGKDFWKRPKWRVKALFVFPIKSCQGVELSRNIVIKTGMQYDRQFAFAQNASIVDDDGKHTGQKEWRFITQRAWPKLALVRPELWLPNEKASSYKPYITYVKGGGCIAVSFPYSGKITLSMEGIKSLIQRVLAKLRNLSFSAEPRVEFRVPFDPTPEQIEQMQLKPKLMRIWKDQPEALDMSPIIPKDVLEKLRTFLGIENEFTLFRVQREKERLIFKNAPSKEDLGYQAIHGFTDAYPLHFNNLASIHELATHLPDNFGKLSALRFRSNMYITGPLPYDEDYWTKVKIGDATYIVTNRTTRCTLPNVNPATGTTVRYQNSKDDKAKAANKLFNEPLKTMKTFRCIDEGAPETPCLGMQMVPVDPDNNEVRVGDEVVVLDRGKHYKL